jgi:hypothetical protein
MTPLLETYNIYKKKGSIVMNREQMIKEARTIEAMKKGYMGLEGKFSCIAKNLGQPIIQQGSRVFEQSFLDDPYETEIDVEDILIFDEDESSYEIGLQFDGLSRGVNMTISIQYHLREITCRYQGNIVYKENSGDLEGYVPNSEWEEKIEAFYDLSKNIEKKNKPIEQEKNTEKNNRKRKEIMEYLKLKWGL